MPQRDAILAPIPGEKPGGQDLRYDPVYDKIKEARREEDELPQGAWQIERKTADFDLVIRLTEEALSSRSKDLQLAAWMTEALLNKQGFDGLHEGLLICEGLTVQFWDTVYPLLEDGDAEYRAAPLEWLATRIDVPVKRVALCRAGYDFFKYKESRTVQYEDQAKEKDQKAAREAAIKAGKLTPETFDRAFGETPKSFYAETEANLDACLSAVTTVDKTCREKFQDYAPSFNRLRSALDEVRQVVHALLNKKRELEPDPVVEAPPPEPAASGEETPLEVETTGLLPPSGFTAPKLAVEAPEEPADRRDAIAAVVATAAFLRRREPRSPAPYLMLRGLRWGELRAAIQSAEPDKLEAPPTELRRLLKKLSVEKKWKELIETAENAMALPCSRAWLDLQRLVVQACTAVGEDYAPIVMAIQSEIRALARDVPQLLDLVLMDDTPAANSETRAWILSLMEEPQAVSPKLPGPGFALNGHTGAEWQQKFVDSYAMAQAAVKAGHEQKAFEILQGEIQKQRSGRGRFERRLQMVQLCVSTGKEALMQPLLEDLLAAVENHKLEEWEDREMLAAALATILKASKKIQGDAKEKQKLFERICRLDPVQALSVG